MGDGWDGALFFEVQWVEMTEEIEGKPPRKIKMDSRERAAYVTVLDGAEPLENTIRGFVVNCPYEVVDVEKVSRGSPKDFKSVVTFVASFRAGGDANRFRGLAKPVKLFLSHRGGRFVLTRTESRLNMATEARFEKIAKAVREYVRTRVPSA